jgi:galactoside O-acetyltransferase
MVDWTNLFVSGLDVRIAPTVVWKLAHNAVVGSHIAIDDFTVITTQIEMGSYVHISQHVTIIGGADAKLRTGNFCTISAGARIICRGDAMLGAGLVGPIIPDKYRDDLIGEETVLGDYVSIGTNAVLMPNIRIAEGVVVGAGAVVTKTIGEPWTVWAGVPAVRIKNRLRTKMIAYGEELLKNG